MKEQNNNMMLYMANVFESSDNKCDGNPEKGDGALLLLERLEK